MTVTRMIVAAALAAACALAPAAAQDAPKSKLAAGPAGFKEKAPDVFKARFETSKGEIVIEVHREWSPNGADRFYNLVKNGFFDDIRFFRVVPNFVVQFGIPADPAVGGAWSRANIPDDPVKQGNKKGFVTFAKSNAPNSRSTQLFINLKDNTPLDAMGFAAIGQVVEGMDVVEKLNGEYGESLTSEQGQIYAKGNAFLKERAPNLDYVKKARVL